MFISVVLIRKIGSDFSLFLVNLIIVLSVFIVKVRFSFSCCLCVSISVLNSFVESVVDVLMRVDGSFISDLKLRLLIISVVRMVLILIVFVVRVCVV